ncbi:DUF268 domain-containing protein [Helicobacter sp. MIT 21-1697]|uniref:DUF268 domain-containing protein n=1 Tax=Helicobacter sp. MIT 21-1697 TaxID=2993733 RepID=UPI00224B633F|nr:DUF268 domain-containing protein [Helicobacter sp. MIT 21-1697]MCX2716313.1 DUF268 domain-containing protein [Helicobacter sp. MIT 21-1697]
MQKKTLAQKIVRETLRLFGKYPLPSHKMMSNAEIAQDKATYTRLNKDARFRLDSKWDYICKGDKYAPNGVVDCQYFIQDMWGARKVLEHKPDVHYDVGSSVFGFIAHLLTFNQKITLLDIRPMNNQFNTSFLNERGGGITYIQSNATRLENIADDSIQSLSALCSVEHFGLGRYGDPIEPDAWESALKAFQRVLQSNGRLYLSVPVADEDKLCFNAHRIYKPQTIIDALDSMQIVQMGYIKDFDVIECMKWENNSLHINQNALDSMPKAHNRAYYTGLFEFIKN